MSTLTISHPTAKIARPSAEAVRQIALWAIVAVIIVIPALLSAVVLLRG